MLRRSACGPRTIRFILPLLAAVACAWQLAGAPGRHDHAAGGPRGTARRWVADRRRMRETARLASSSRSSSRAAVGIES